MKTINISDLEEDLSGCLQHVRDGEEMVICDQDVPVARIIPIPVRRDDLSDHEARLVADGRMTVPKQEMDWERFFAIRRGNVSTEVAIQAVIDSRGDW